MDESKNAAEPRRGQPRGTASRIWSAHGRELRDRPASYSHTVQAAARDAVLAALAHGPHTSPTPRPRSDTSWDGWTSNTAPGSCRT